MNSEIQNGYIHVLALGYGQTMKSGTPRASFKTLDITHVESLIFTQSSDCTRLCSPDCIPMFHLCISTQCPEPMSSQETASFQLSELMLRLSQTLSNWVQQISSAVTKCSNEIRILLNSLTSVLNALRRSSRCRTVGQSLRGRISRRMKSMANGSTNTRSRAYIMRMFQEV